MHIIAKKSVKMSVALLVDVSIRGTLILYLDHFMNFVESYLLAGLEVLSLSPNLRLHLYFVHPISKGPGETAQAYLSIRFSPIG